MCTLTWRLFEAGYAVYFNRDELKSRAPELEPIQFNEPVPYVSPRDGNFGGTWIAANAYGLTCCLANYYPSDRLPGLGKESRGLIIPKLIHCRDAASVLSLISQWDLSVYAPFSLLVFHLNQQPMHITWDTRSLTHRFFTLEQPIFTSSSCNSEEVIADRYRFFEDLRGEGPITPGLCEGFIQAHSPVAVCMHREDADTMSHTRLTVQSGHIHFRHYMGPLCQEPNFKEFVLRMAV